MNNIECLKNSDINIEIEESIYYIRGCKVMLDRDLARLYSTETKRLIQSVKRNIDRFPNDFMFQLNKEEFISLNEFNIFSSRSQIVTLKRGGNIKYLPYVFTEQGIAMLSSILKSSQAIKINIEIMRTFTKLRKVLSSQAKIDKEIKDIKNYILKNSLNYSREFKRIWITIEKLSNPSAVNNRKIGFRLD